MRTILTAIFLLSGLILGAQQRQGVVNFSANFQREEPSYPAELGNQQLMGTVVDILDSESYWLKVKSPEPYTGWVTNMGIVEMSPEEIPAYIAAPKYIVLSEYSRVYREPSAKSGRICDLVMGDLLRKNGDRKKKGFLPVLLPSGVKGWVKASDLQDFSSWVHGTRPSAEAVLNLAEKFIGVPYQWGANSPKGVDCSGLVRTVFFMNGVLLPRNASQQARTGDEIDISGIASGDFSALQKGDLLFFGNKQTGRVTHVTIYMGEAHIIHSSLVVRINSLVPGTPDYYSSSPNLLCARRVIGREDSGKGIVSIESSPAYFPDN